MKRGKALKPGNPMKRGRRKPRPSLRDFHNAVCHRPCALLSADCYGWLEPHHYIAKQHLRHDDAAYVDPRNGVSLCAFHHAQVENARVECPRPPELDEFLADYGLIERERAA